MVGGHCFMGFETMEFYIFIITQIVYEIVSNQLHVLLLLFCIYRHI